MENNKEIGKALREKLDQLDRTPNDALWSKIDSDLDSKKKKKSIFWFVPVWVLSGLLLGGLYYTFYLTENDGNPTPENLENKIVLEREKTWGEEKKDSKEGKKTITEENNASAAGKKTLREENIAITEGKKTLREENIASREREKTSREENNAIAEGKYASTEGKKTLREGEKTSREENKAITEQEKASAERKSASSAPKSKIGSNGVSYKTVHSSESARTVKKTKRLVKSTDEYDEYEVVQKYTYIVKKKKKTIRIPEKKTYHAKNKNGNHFSKNNPKSKLKPSLKTKKQPADPTELTLIDSGKNNQEAMETKIDTVAAVLTIAATAPKIIPKKELKKPIPKDSIKTEKEKKNTLYITPYFAPTAYESFAKGNSVSSRYQNDTKKSVLTYSYGCYVRWMFNDRIGSRTGVGKTNLKYATNIQKSNPDFIDTKNINLVSGMTAAEINTRFENDAEVIMTQKLSYYEVPLEAYYVFSDHKIGVATSFGFSFLFLDENELTLKSNSVNEYKIGSAKNTISQSVTGNLRLILDYKLTKSLQLELSPSFQYHALGFKNVSDFKPYVLSLQAGFSYKL